MFALTTALLTGDAAYIYANKIDVRKSLESFNECDSKTKVAVGGLAGLSAIFSLYSLNAMTGTDPIGRTLALMRKFFVQEKSRNIKVDDWINTYNELHDDQVKGVEQRNTAYQTLVNAYYELATLVSILLLFSRFSFMFYVLSYYLFFSIEKLVLRVGLGRVISFCFPTSLRDF